LGFFAGHRLTRDDFAVALGGGVVGDMAGFAAAVYLRGIDFVQIPTTLLAQVDASVGGKTGCDLPTGKNLAGAFRQPRAVVMDPRLLKTLPPEQFASGMAEVIKTAAIKDEELFCHLEDWTLIDVIARSVEIKRGVVERDEFERGERMLLNFGHTAGHAIERAYGFEGITHGAAVACGMAAAAEIGHKLGITPQNAEESLREALIRHGLPTGTAVKRSEMMDGIAGDKKRTGGAINFVVLEKIGAARTVKLELEQLAALL
ncbi:MAG: 3-dehydroquinate synthase, partial [Oscillospiraceae bacterium]|nr:3-dehydroquinate synthase [Oscillospiraceae bacterium]